MTDYSYQKQLARALLSAGIEPIDLELHPPAAALAAAGAMALPRLSIPYPAGLAPTPAPLDPQPATSDALPKADVVVVTWTIDEQRALADVLTPRFGKDRWYRYNRNYAVFDSLIRKGAPAKMAKRLGSYFVTKIGDKTVLCFKSELHLNQDGIRSATAPGTATLPVKDLFHQIIDEAAPDVILSAGTAGGVYAQQDLGDVVVTRAAKFRLSDEFRNEPFNNLKYVSRWRIPATHFAAAEQLMSAFAGKIQEPAEFLPPTVSFIEPAGGWPKPARPYAPDIWLDGQVMNGHRKMPAFHPILTTDYFEYGTSTNHLEREGCAVEMGDAVLGLAIDERKKAHKSTPKWAIVRNCSDPQINGLLKDEPKSESLQVNWAVYYYTAFGYWTSVMSSLAVWAIVAGL